MVRIITSSADLSAQSSSPACISWSSTVPVLERLRESVRARRTNRRLLYEKSVEVVSKSGTSTPFLGPNGKTGAVLNDDVPNGTQQ